MKNLLKRYRSDLSGNFATMTAILALPVLMATAAAVDMSSLQKAKTELKDAAETAAVASAKSTKRNDNMRKEAALLALDANFDKTSHGIGDLDVSVELTPIRSTVEASTIVPTRLMGIVGKKNLNLKVRVAAETMIEPACILIKSPSSSNALRFQGHPLLNTVDCYVHNNSSSAQSSVAQGNPQLGDAEVCLNGGFEGKKWVPGPELDCGVKNDPFSSVARPGIPSCMAQPKKGKPGTPISLSPGNYCGGLSVPANGNFNLSPGTYVISDGSLKLGANASLSGEGVMFYLTGNASNFDLHSGGNWDISPPSSGEYRGIAIYQDPTSTPSKANAVTGGGTINFEGVIYTPRAELKLHGSPTLNIRGGGNMIVTDRLTLQGSPELNVVIDNRADLMPNDEIIGRDAYIRVIK